MNLDQWLGKENKVGQDIWKNKYQQNNETLDEWFDRISNKNEEVKKLIKEKKFLFGGRVLSARNINSKLSYSNCYVIKAPEDNLEDINRCCGEMARTYSYGGGVGIDISNLRPRGTPVNNAAKYSSGAVSFMSLFSEVTATIAQSGRRGALMICLDCCHPDIEEFITIKSDLSKVNKANISVKMSDEFMQAVVDNKNIDLKYNEKVFKNINAKDLFMKFSEMNWDFAEPGCLFWDRIKNYNFLDNVKEFNYDGTNPCLIGDTIIQTIHGERKIKDLVGETPIVYSIDENNNLVLKKAKRVWKTKENAKIIKVITGKGEIVCTPEHLILTKDGWKEAIKLKQGDKVIGLNKMMGDEKHIKIGISGQKYISEHRFIASYLYDIENKDVHHKDGNTLNNDIDNLQVLEHSEYSKITNIGHESFCSKNILTGKFEKQEYHKKRESFNLDKKVGNNWFIKEIIILDYTEDVYDMEVPETHNFIANNIVVHNCAEEPLPAYGSCNLGSINLSAYVKSKEFVHDKNYVPFEFDFDEFRKDVRTCVFALNDVMIEGCERHPLEQQRTVIKRLRQIGLGIMGLADMLIKLGITYGSKNSINLCKSIGSVMINEATRASVDYMKEKQKQFKETKVYSEFIEPHHFYSPETFKESNFVKAVLTEETKQYVLENGGMFNSQLLTCAPTGSLSNLLGISGGIEPIFANFYERKTESLHGKDVKYKIYTPIVKKYMEENNISDDKDLPKYFITSHEISPSKRIDMQAIWQKHIDASISSTVNLNNKASIEDVFNLYLEAWQKGLKGITIFRDGCARNPILSENLSEEKKELKRGELTIKDNLIGLKETLLTGCGHLHCNVFFDDKTGDFHELFLGKGSTGGCLSNLNALARLISLSARGGIKVDDIVEQLKSTPVCPSYYGRTLTKKDTSIGMNCPTAIANCILRLSKKIIPYLNIQKEENKEEKTNKQICPNCGEELVQTGGCMECKHCGWTKCE